MAKSSTADSDTLPEIDWAAFGRAVFSPARPHLAEATSVTREVVGERWRSLRGRSKMSAAARTEALTDPAVVRDVCETIATRLDAEWLFDGGRLFLPYVKIDRIDYEQKRLTRPSDTPWQLSEMPYEVELITALAAGDPRDIKTVEALAMEAAHALVPWGVKMPTRVAWVLLSGGWPEERPSWLNIWNLFSLAAWWQADSEALRLTPGERIDSAVMSSVKKPMRGRKSATVDRYNAVGVASHKARSWWRWETSSRLGLSVTDHNFDFGYPRHLTGTPLRSLQNPNDAPLRIWGLGYAPVDVRGDVVVVGVPSVGEPISAPSWGAIRSLQMKRYGSIGEANP